HQDWESSLPLFLEFVQESDYDGLIIEAEKHIKSILLNEITSSLGDFDDRNEKFRQALVVLAELTAPYRSDPAFQRYMPFVLFEEATLYGLLGEPELKAALYEQINTEFSEFAEDEMYFEVFNPIAYYFAKAEAEAYVEAGEWQAAIDAYLEIIKDSQESTENSVRISESETSIENIIWEKIRSFYGVDSEGLAAQLLAFEVIHEYYRADPAFARFRLFVEYEIASLKGDLGDREQELSELLAIYGILYDDEGLLNDEFYQLLSSRLLTRLANLSLAAEEYEDALDYVDLYILNHGSGCGTQSLRGEIYYQWSVAEGNDADLFWLAIGAYQLAVTEECQRTNACLTAQFQYRLGEIYELLGEDYIEEARSSYEEIVNDEDYQRCSSDVQRAEEALAALD
ncbi:MAG: hypothetical protein ABIE84_04240, partial [bacterium]